MSSFFIMYINFTSKNLNEYNKIIDVLMSCKTPSHHDVVKTMVEQFAKNCDHRLRMLRKYAWIKLLRFSLVGFKNYKSYRHSTDTQIESIVIHCNEWVTQYDQWIQEEREKEEKDKKSKIDIKGFKHLFKKKKRRSE